MTMHGENGTGSRGRGRPHQDSLATVGGQDRAVSFTVSYVLTIAVAVVLVSGVLLAAGGTVRDQRQQTLRYGASVVADETAAAVMQADRLARIGTPSEVAVALDLPERLAGEPYVVRLESDRGSVSISVTATAPPTAVSVPLANRTSVRETAVPGGPTRVVYRPATDELTLVEARA